MLFPIHKRDSTLKNQYAQQVPLLERMFARNDQPIIQVAIAMQHGQYGQLPPLLRTAADLT